MPGVDEFVTSQAALLAWREEHGNSVNAMLGVLFVIRNRANAGWGNGDWLAVMNQTNQFQGKCLTGFPDVRDPQFLQVLQAADNIYSGELQDKLTDGALYFADLNNVDKDSWFATEILAHPHKHPRTAVIGTTTFFK